MTALRLLDGRKGVNMQDVKPPKTTTPAGEDRRTGPDPPEDVLPVTAIKTEPGDEIKDFAESAMDELLGCWYGYEKTKPRGHSAGDSSGGESPKHSDGGCGWCGRALEATPLVTSATGSFCSDLCFSQSRRASFKRNKTCDWCRHIRHTVSYVDVQEGSKQLQFCSDKCLNQYKMHIFCRETQAHLELHPHPPQRIDKEGSTLITPDLWLKDCRDEREASPAPIPAHAPLIDPPRSSTPPRRRPPPRRPHYKRRTSRTSTITTEEPTDTPQDLRVRPREDPPVQPPKPTPWNEEVLKRLPPVTVLVPYPVIIPLPLPIPIPIPLNQFPVEDAPAKVTRSTRKRKRSNDHTVKKKVIPV